MFPDPLQPFRPEGTKLRLRQSISQTKCYKVRRPFLPPMWKVPLPHLKPLWLFNSQWHKPKLPRSRKPGLIRDFVVTKGEVSKDDVFVVEDCVEAAEKAVELAGDGELIVNTGSIFCVSAVFLFLEG